MTNSHTCILTGDDRIHQWQSDLGSKTWPRFMQQDKLVSALWPDLYSKFPEFQFAMLEDDRLLGIGNSLPLRWNQAPGELPDRGLDWAMDKYIHWKNEENLPFDPWIRVHIKAGGKIIQPCSRSMDISGTIAEWEEWTNTRVYSSGDYIIDQALVPVQMDREKDMGYYMEPNVWIVHQAGHPFPIT